MVIPTIFIGEVLYDLGIRLTSYLSLPIVFVPISAAHQSTTPHFAIFALSSLGIARQRLRASRVVMARKLDQSCTAQEGAVLRFGLFGR